MHIVSYLKIVRPLNGLMASFAVFIGFFVGSLGLFLEQSLLLAIASVFFFSSAGIVLNDYFDYEMDKVNAPHRPLPSGKIAKKTALYYSMALFAFAIAIAFFINIYCLGLALLNTVLEILYAWKFKRIALLGNFVDSWFPASSFLYGALAALSLGSVPLLALLAFLANSGREIYGDIEDIKGDLKEKAKTLPIMVGARNARIIANVFVLSAVFLSVLPWYFGILNINYLFVVALADLVFIASMFVKPKQNQFLSKVAMIIAMIAFVVGVI